MSETDPAIVLPAELHAILRAQVASGRFADPAAALEAALRLLDRTTPAEGGEASSGPGAELARMREAHERLFAAKRERDLIIELAARQRTIPHPEAIMQMTASALGAHLGADRTGFYRVVGDKVEFGACWTAGRIALLRGRLPLSAFGDGLVAALREGRPVVTENSYEDPLRAAGISAQLRAIAVMSMPLVRDMSWSAGLYVHHGEPRRWREEEVAFASEVAELSWDAVERADALNRLAAEVERGEERLDRAASDLRDEVAGRLTAEGQVRQMQKMEAVGQLAGGIAHDFNNMLAAIISGLGLVERRLARGETDVARFLDGAVESANRAASLTRRLLAFSRQQPLTPEPLDVNRTVGGMMELLARTLGDAVEVETVQSAGVWTVWADGGQLENAVLNLAVNSRDAMPDGGRLTIETSNAHVDGAYARENGLLEGQYVVVAVSDTGAGIPPADLERVFEPFYTTKAVGKGTGLGLPQVFGFARQSNGNVKIYSEPGHGTTVKLYLPRYYGDAAPGVARRAAAAEPARGGSAWEIVLVVEDEDRVRMFSVDALRELGYTVMHARDGAEALAILDRGLDVSLLFTDIVMPGMTGRELVDRARISRPELRVLYTTGFTRNAVVHNGVLDPGTRLLVKPFTLEQLAAQVRAALEA